MRTDLGTWGGGKESVGQMDRVAWEHIVSCVKQIASRNFLCDSGNSNWGSVTTYRSGMGWDGVGGGRKVLEGGDTYLWLIHVVVWQKPTQYCKAIILQLKLSKFKKKMCRRASMCFLRHDPLITFFTCFIGLVLCFNHVKPNNAFSRGLSSCS